MGQDNRGALVSRLKVWASQLWLNFLSNMMMVTVTAEQTMNKANSESVKHSSKKVSEDHQEFMDNFKVGNCVKFIDLLGHDEKAWNMSRIEFKMLENYVGKTGKIIDAVILEEVPVPYNLFLTVQFSDGYVIYDASYYAFGPPEFTVIDFVKEKERIQQSREGNE